MIRLYRAAFKFDPRDLWVGVYWKLAESGFYAERPYVWDIYHIYICLIPMIPLFLRVGIKHRCSPSKTDS